MFVGALKCLKCKREYQPTEKIYVCKECGGKLDIQYDYDKIAERITKEDLEGRPAGVWKYQEFLPIADTENMITLDEGGTPLLEAKNLAQELGIRQLWLKDETRNPTSSFKDRPMSVGISKAVEFGAETVVTASSGNAATALAAYSAKVGIKCYAFVPAETSAAKLAQLSIYGARVIRARTKGVGDPAYKLMQMTYERYGWHPIPSCGRFNPYQPEGSKTMSYEICEQLGWEVPDWVMIPVGAGTLLTGNAKGYFEFEQLGFTDNLPRLAGIQAEGCAPLVKGFKDSTDPYKIPTWENPQTIAGGLVDPYPWDADTAIPAIKRSNGTAETVSDGEILNAGKMLARFEGVFAEPSGAAGLAGLIKLLNAGVVDRSDRVVIEVTGGGLKDQETVAKLIEEPPTIEPEPEQLEKILGS